MPLRDVPGVDHGEPWELIAPSAVKHDENYESPREMTHADIERTLDALVTSQRIAAKIFFAGGAARVHAPAADLGWLTLGELRLRLQVAAGARVGQPDRCRGGRGAVGEIDEWSARIGRRGRPRTCRARAPRVVSCQPPASSSSC